MPRHPSLQLASLLFAGAVLAGAGARAAELGDAKVNSYLGQQLSADIELTSLRDAAGTVLVRVASVDVYRGAGLELPPVLSSVNLAVVRRDGRQFLHVTSTRPIEADHLHLYLELTDGGQRGVRLATLWFTPDPTPPAPRLVAAPVPAPPVVQEIAPRRTVRAPARALPPSHQKLVRPLPEPNTAKEEVKPPPPAPEPAKAPEPAAVKPSQPEKKPPQVAHEKPKPEAPKLAPLALAAAKASQAHPAVIPPPKPVAACPKEPSQAEATCSALDGKNAELRAELVKLEERVKTLQAEAQARAVAEAKARAAAKPVEAPKPVVPAKPPPVKKEGERPAADEKFGQVIEEPPPHAPVFKPVKLKAVVPVAAPVPAAPEELPAGMPWGWIAGAGGGVFATIGGAQFWRHRRKQAKVHRVHAPLPEHDDEELVEPTLG